MCGYLIWVRLFDYRLVVLVQVFISCIWVFLWLVRCRQFRVCWLMENIVVVVLNFGVMLEMVVWLLMVSVVVFLLQNLIYVLIMCFLCRNLVNVSMMLVQVMLGCGWLVSFMLMMLGRCIYEVWLSIMFFVFRLFMLIVIMFSVLICGVWLLVLMQVFGKVMFLCIWIIGDIFFRLIWCMMLLFGGIMLMFLNVFLVQLMKWNWFLL